MTFTDQERLAAIRTQSEIWIAMRPEAVTWETAFLLRIIDKMRKAAPIVRGG
jgi:hypothetical protein